MNLKDSPKPELFLEEALTELHRQSDAWLHILDFWKTEAELLSRLLTKNLQLNAGDSLSRRIHQSIQELAVERTDHLIRKVQTHEKMLRLALFEPRILESQYRESHADLLREISSLESELQHLRELLRIVAFKNTGDQKHSPETLKVIEHRRAVRRYAADTVDPDHLDQILRAAEMAPSALNLQPWKFYILSDPDRIFKYAREIFSEADKKYHNLIGAFINRTDPIFYGAPVVIFISGPKDNEWAHVDAGLCAENLMLAAKSLGYDTCPVGFGRFISKAPSFAELGLGSGEEIILAIALGVAAEIPLPHPRKKDTRVYL